jgi:hypothetical protein
MKAYGGVDVTLPLLCYNSSMPITIGWMTGFLFPARVINSSLLKNIESDSGAYLASYPIGTGGTFPGDKATGA